MMQKRSLRYTLAPYMIRSKEGLLHYDLAKIAATVGGGVSFDPAVSEDKTATGLTGTWYDPLAGLPDRITRKQRPPQCSLEAFADRLFQEVVQYFLDLWDDSPKLVWHSAGHDSRIMSLALRQVLEEIGPDRFGTVLFRVHQPEEEAFFRIMEIQGWPRHICTAWTGSKMDYYDIGRGGFVMNGYHPVEQSMDFWSDVAGPEWTVIAGFGGETFKLAAKYPDFPTTICPNTMLARLVEHHPGHQWLGMILRDFRDGWFPFLSLEYLQQATRWPEEECTWDGAIDNVRRAIIESRCPELMEVPYGRHAYTWRVSAERRQAMALRYYSGAFYRDTRLPCSPLNSKEESRLWSLATVYDSLQGP